MRKKSKKIRNLAIYGIIGIIAYALIFQGGLPFVSADFNIPEMRTVGSSRNSAGGSGQGSTSSSSSAGYFDCSVRLASYSIDGRGNTIKSYSGNIFTDSVTLSLTDDGIDLAGLVMIPQIKCNATTSDEYQMLIRDTKLQVTVSVDGKAFDSKAMSINNKKLQKNQWSDVGNFAYYASVLEEKIKQQRGDGDYTANVKFILRGTVNVFWGSTQGYGYDYKFGIPSGKVSVTAPIEVKTDKPQDPDGDGFIGEYDDCPNEPETFNGYDDYDGCPDEVKDDTQKETTPDTPTTPENEKELHDATILHHVKLFYTNGKEKQLQVQGGNVELVMQSVAPKPQLARGGDAIDKIVIQPYLMVGSPDWSMHNAQYTAKAVMTVMGVDYEIPIGSPSRVVTTSAQDIMNQGYGLALGKVTLDKITIQSKQIMEVINPTPIEFEVQIDGEVQLRNVRDQGIYKGVVISTLELTNMKYGNPSLPDDETPDECAGLAGMFSPACKPDDDFEPTPENPCPVGVQNKQTLTCDKETNKDLDGDGEITVTDDKTFKEKCESNGWTVIQSKSGNLSCVEPEDSGNGGTDTNGTGGTNVVTEEEGGVTTTGGLTGWCSGELSREQCIQKLLSDPYSLVMLIVAGVIFIGLIGGMVARSKNNYGFNVPSVRY